MSDNQTITHQTPFYRFARFVVTSYFRLSYNLRVEGLENIPVDGGIIIASNHLSNLDPPLIGICVTRYIRFMGKAELFSVPVLGKIFSVLGAFPIHRGKIDKNAIRTAINVVQSDGCLVMFPEGHRSKTGELGSFLPGVASIAKKANGVVVPAAIVGPYRRFRPLMVRFGEPMEARSESGRDFLDELRDRIESLLRQDGNQS
ncbi:lysophospholipid acyltransferase family protein [Alicyclobacillus dauci]|uniref:1-acyl-sn-glycerol-3-phosphate acyltransferase n=1 Tax=Alicyclobacillus dauci TaxID=1475485 RepID=A0ABY6YZF7_9BACL|nr:lysophospholipid acyltransferase family protein [Alicyclobacillus dauci]WAH35090.1 1-acyl-sn-glycerol-3-phosphate acyltransferase [Alicyclobacillus dauci]